MILFALAGMFISSLAVIACPSFSCTSTSTTKVVETEEESGISAWHFATTGFKY